MSQATPFNRLDSRLRGKDGGSAGDEPRETNEEKCRKDEWGVSSYSHFFVSVSINATEGIFRGSFKITRHRMISGLPLVPL